MPDEPRAVEPKRTRGTTMPCCESDTAVAAPAPRSVYPDAPGTSTDEPCASLPSHRSFGARWDTESYAASMAVA